MRVFRALVALVVLSLGAHAQTNPYNLSSYPSQTFSGVATGAAISLSQNSGGSFGAGTISLTGTGITTVTFQVQGSNDGGASFFPLYVTGVTDPTITGSTVTATTSGLYSVSLAGLTHVRFVTSGTFTASAAVLKLTASPNVSRNGPGGNSTGGGPPTGAAGGDLVGTYPNPTVKPSISNAQQIPSARVVYNKGYYTSVTSDWTVVGQTPSLSTAGNIIINPGTLGSLTAQQLQLTNNCFNQTAAGNCTSPDDQTDMEFDFTVNSLTGNGLALGRYGNNTTQNDSTGWNINFSAGPSGGGPYLSVNTMKNNVNTPINIVTLQYTPAVNDRFHAVISQRGNLYFGFVEDMTQKKITTVTFQTPAGPTGAVNDQVNTAKPLIAGFGGSYTITNIRMVSRQPMYPDLCVIGNSKASWYNASSPSMRFASNLTALGSVAVFAGAGDGISELQTAVPYIQNFGCRQVLLAEAGRNSVCTGIAAATWQAQYAAVAAAFTVPVFHTGIIPETSCSSTNQTAYNSYITSTFPSANYVDVITGYSTATMMSSDNVHPNDPGHAFLAYAISHSVIPTVSNPVMQIANSPNDVTRGGIPVYGDQRNVFTDTQIMTAARLTSAAPSSIVTVASQATLALTTPSAYVSGTNAISLITPPVANCTSSGTECTVKLIPTGLWTLATGGTANALSYAIAIASTASINRTMILTCDPGARLCYPSY